MRRRWITWTIVAIAWWCSGSSVQADPIMVDTAWDLLQTISGTHFMGVPCAGVPMDTFDFGGSIGPVNVGPNTDTIMLRGPASVSNPGDSTTAPLTLVALQLVSTAGPQYFITLQSDRGGPASTGHMDITFDDANGGTWDSFFDVFFDIRIGSLDGTIVESGKCEFESLDNTWSRTPSAEALLIDGVNHMVNGSNIDGDFWPGVPLQEITPLGDAKHVVTTASKIPAPGAALLGVVGLAAVGWIKRRL